MRSALAPFTVLLLAIVGCTGEHRRIANDESVDSAIVDLKKQLEASPGSSSLHGELASMLAAKGDWEHSDKEMSTAIELDPRDATLYIGAAQSYRARGMKGKGIEMLNRALIIDTQNPLSHFFLGVMYEGQSEPGKALAEFHETKRLIDTLSLPASSPDLRNRIIRGTDDQTWYRDQFGKEYRLDDILKPLAKKLSQ